MESYTQGGINAIKERKHARVQKVSNLFGFRKIIAFSGHSFSSISCLKYSLFHELVLLPLFL